MGKSPSSSLVRTTLICAIAVWAFGAAGQCESLGLPPPVAPQGFGVNIHFTNVSSQELNELSDAGIGFIRMDFSWQSVEAKPGIYDFRHYDGLTSMLATHGIRPVYILDYGNSNYDGGLSPYTDKGRLAFANFAAAAAAHFRGRGVVWELWNEPNGGFWKPAPNANDYADLAITTARAMCAADPDACIVAPASSGFPWSFFETIFQRGLLKYIDAVSVHPYRQSTPETATTDYTRLRRLIARYTPAGQVQIPIICSEWGYSTSWTGITESDQANYLVREWLSNLADGIDLSIYYDWKDDGLDPSNPEHNFGTLHNDLTPKPAYLAAQGLIQELTGFRFIHRLPMGSPAQWKLLFARGSKLAVVEWNSEPAASATDQTPRVRLVQPGDADYSWMLRCDEFRYVSQVLVPTPDAPAILNISITNEEQRPASITIAVGSESRKVHLKVRETADLRFSLPFQASPTDGTVNVPVTALWNSQTVSGLPQARIAPLSPVALSVAPAFDGLRITVDNLGPTTFDGLLAPGGTARPMKIHVDLGTASIITLPGDPLRPIASAVENSKGQAVTLASHAEFAPFPGFPDSVTDASDMSLIDFPNNSPSAPKTMQVVALPPGSPARAGIAMHYLTSEDWFYTTAGPVHPLIIPDNAVRISLWIYASGDALPLRARFIDATGQTFQPNLGNLDWTGWRAITIPLSGSMEHWGGANDGIQHSPLTLDSLVLVDGTKHSPGNGQILLAYPAFEVR